MKSSTPASIALCVAFCGLSMLTTSAFAASLQALELQDAELAAAYQALAAAQATPPDFSKFLPQISFNTTNTLPCRRPQPYSKPRRLSTPGLKWKLEQKNDTNVAFWTVEHPPVYNISIDMFKWMVANLDRRVKDPRNGRIFPMFLLLHPIDHAQLTWDPKNKPLKVQDPADLFTINSTLWEWSMIPASNCIGQFNNAAEPVVCPARRKGFNCNVTPEQLAALRSIKIQLRCLEISNTATAFAYLFNIKEATGLNINIPFIQNRWSYKEDKNINAVRFTTKWTIGHDSVLAKNNGDINGKLVQPLYAQRISPINGDWRKAAMYDILYDAQMLGFLPQWLPAVYAEAMKISSAAAETSD